MITYSQYSDFGYEVSSAGDTRFSALFARMSDGRTLEAHYQCDVKGYQPGGTDWARYKGRRPRNRTSAQLWQGFLGLWQVWAVSNPLLIVELHAITVDNGYHLTDKFASSEINQAHALAEILNEIYYR